ncbi:uncharacterized protein EDB91DRAFT_1143850 [Suillus paluster]|uniref:uncharacterized protein n=1 Tax=Suillus paluster TaxID=48578 RepID=UPI001B865E60|nr:uncharacterized protein EDB91DRAFT_1175549 [Suillus paluster]XP_041175308.1 uncharacterized protein EDB91DRAFT_1143850 [Suillus paluster]KAG1721897.1 hypothetical protein EDB91DRAFT_1175549 [Suillus paluster]KAG1735698.1 hypothetical protein EDB91DRAFT_1143850 [Suillus paluster]
MQSSQHQRIFTSATEMSADATSGPGVMLKGWRQAYKKHNQLLSGLPHRLGQINSHSHSKRNHALGMRVSRAPLQKAHAIKKATARTIAQTTKHTTFALKNKNIITDTVRDTICELVATHDVPVSSVRGVFGVIAEDINKMRVAELDLQIRWHRQFDSQIPAAKDLKGKKAPEKRAILAAAAERLSSGEVGPNTDEAATMQEIEGHDTTNVGALLGDSDEENDS